MTRRLCDSQFIYGLHDPGGEHLMLEAGKPGWVLFTEAIGSNPGDGSGKDFSPWSGRELGVITRLNNGYEPHGTIPISERYRDFAQRCGNYVRSSRGCHIWIIGNEMNFVVERPSLPGRSASPLAPSRLPSGVDEPPPSSREHPERFSALLERVEPTRSVRSAASDREVITPQLYATCYRLCRDAIRAQPGHEADQVLVGAPAPWNNQTQYEGNPHGDWVQYFQDILRLLGPDRCDGFTLHAYTHGANRDLIHSSAKMDAPFNNRHYHFFTYRDFMQAVPASMRHLPAYITEADQDVEWHNENTGWVQRAYGDIDWWNQQPGNQQIRALILYRWPRHDKWYIEGKQGVIEDFRQAMSQGYRWRETPVTQPEPTPAYRVAFLEGGNLRSAVGREVVTTRFTLRNEGGRTWRRGGNNPVRLGYHWETTGGEPVLLPQDRDFRTSLPKDVAPGATVLMEGVKVAIPDLVGAFRLRWDLVEEGVTWFKDQGSSEKVENVVIRGAPPVQEVVVPETGKRIREPFLTWYREQGLDVTGYPITEEFQDGATSLKTQYFQRVVMEEHPEGRIRLRLAGQELAEALRRVAETEGSVAELRQQIQDLEERLRVALEQGGHPAGRIQEPAIMDLVNQLPRDAQRFVSRQAATLRYLVIHHSGGPASLTPEEIAGYHRQRGYPGLAYNYLIGADGTIFRTNPALETVSADTFWIEGLHVAFAGNFGNVVPTDAQMAAGAQLCAWLLQEYGLTRENAIRGVSEFMAHGSPGAQWLGGRRYKDMLLARIAAVQDQLAQPPDSGDPEALARLRAQVAELQGQLGEKERQLAGQQASIIQLQKDLQLRDSQIGQLQSQVDQNQAELSQVRQQLTQARSQAEEAQRQLVATQADLQQAQARLTARQAELQQAQAQLSARQAELQQVRTQLAARQAELQQAQAQLTARQAELRQAQDQLVALRSELQQVQAQLADRDAELARANQQVQAGQAEIVRLQAALDAARNGTTPPSPNGRHVPPPRLKDVVDELPKHRTLTYQTRRLRAITHLCIHHSAVAANIPVVNIADYHVSGRGWPGIGYHFYVKPDGIIYQTNRLETISYQVANNNHYTVGICVSGDFTRAVPTEDHLNSAAHLVAWLMDELGVPEENIQGHKEFPDNDTSCPGEQWLKGQRWRDMLLERVRAVQASVAAGGLLKPVGHYLLFWQTPEMWAREDWLAAENYIARFRPTTGFSLDDALHAEVVTIVGGVAGVSYQAEQMLRASGTRVERVAGADFAETKALLDEMAESGRRFRELEG